MWMKETTDGDYIVEKQGVTWLTTELKKLVRVAILDPWSKQWVYLPSCPKKCRYHHFRRQKSLIGVGTSKVGPDRVVAEFLVIEDQGGNHIHGIKVDYSKEKLKIW